MEKRRHVPVKATQIPGFTHARQFAIRKGGAVEAHDLSQSEPHEMPGVRAVKVDGVLHFEHREGENVFMAPIPAGQLLSGAEHVKVPTVKIPVRTSEALRHFSETDGGTQWKTTTVQSHFRGFGWGPTTAHS